MDNKTTNAVVQVSVSKAHVFKAGSLVCEWEEVGLLGFEELVKSWPP